MRPFLLTFRNAELEQQYDAYTRTRRKQDRLYFLTQAGAQSVVAWRLFLMLGTSASSLTALGVVCLFVVELLVSCIGPANWRLWLERNREKAAAGTRLLHVLIFGLCLPSWMVEPEEVPAQNSMEIVSGLFLVSACMQQFHIGLGLRLRFQQHLVLQALSSAWFMLTLNKECCARAMLSEGGPLIHSVVAWMDRAMVALLQIFYSMYGYLPSERDPHKDPCLHLTSFFHLSLGFVVCSYVVWVLERASRIAFLERLDPEQKAWANVDETTALVMLLHIVFLAASFAICWRISSEVGEAIQIHGFVWKYG